MRFTGVQHEIMPDNNKPSIQVPWYQRFTAENSWFSEKNLSATCLLYIMFYIRFFSFSQLLRHL